MNNDWKTDRTEVAIKEGTDKIMKAAQQLAKKEEPLFKEQIERAKKSLENVESLPEVDETLGEPGSFQVCLGTGMNQLFPEYITINLRDNEQPR